MFNLPILNKKSYEIKPVVLIVMDGFGLAPPSQGNAISLAKKPNFDSYWENYPHGELLASGESVGLPANEVGNTEVGHLTMGAGRIILQDLKRINLAIEKGYIYDNSALIKATSHVKENKSKLHILGLASSGSVHSSIDHLYAILQFCKKEEISNVCLHLFTDGRDAPPNESIEIIEKLDIYTEKNRFAKFSTIAGRYYAMDRDRRWSRTEKAYKAMVLGAGAQAKSAVEAVKSAYAKGQTDEFIEPTVISDAGGEKLTIEDNDAVIFFNFRVDRPRQLTMAFVLPDFEDLKTFKFDTYQGAVKKEGEVKISGTFNREKVPKNLFFVTMTEYQKNLPVSAIAFGPEHVINPLGKMISDAGLRQLHMAESEKERFVKYYFNGMQEDAFPGEDDVIISSPKVATYDKKPEMSLPKSASECIKRIKKDIYSFVLINFANPDMVAHSGNLKASVQAIEYVDKYLGKIVETVLQHDGTCLVTADHGNAEDLLTFPTSSFYFTSAKGSINTEHSNNPVPLVVISNSLKGKRIILPQGGLSDLAPTILEMLNINIPKEMVGRNLLSVLKENVSREKLSEVVKNSD